MPATSTTVTDADSYIRKGDIHLTYALPSGFIRVPVIVFASPAPALLRLVGRSPDACLTSPGRASCIVHPAHLLSFRSVAENKVDSRILAHTHVQASHRRIHHLFSGASRCRHLTTWAVSLRLTAHCNPTDGLHRRRSRTAKPKWDDSTTAHRPFFLTHTATTVLNSLTPVIHPHCPSSSLGTS